MFLLNIPSNVTHSPVKFRDIGIKDISFLKVNYKKEKTINKNYYVIIYFAQLINMIYQILYHR